ncbi:hypothetical protein B0T18DRAFT_174496 [Schizothecium vesticola]|uniref:Uncharacterized protein n=1 Tax=Schizothecium vesticola TaxID=314040 RepID=A0AA40EPC0_9PEZI|nr:hypothetical protein B0T18DRAFT_174496 [Schizothecium vesticola]
MRPALFFAIATLSGLGLAVSAVDDFVDVLTSLTTECEALMGPASQVSVLNAPLFLLGAGPWATVVDGFADMAATLTAATSALPPTTQFTDDDSAAVADAFSSFSTAQRGVLISSFIREGTVFKAVPGVGKRIAGVIEVAAAAAETTVAIILDFEDDPDFERTVQTDMGSMRDAFEAAIAAVS